MRAIQGQSVPPQPQNNPGPLRRIRGLRRRVGAAVTGWLARLSPGLRSGRSEDEDLWLLLASDPDGIWYAWPDLERKTESDRLDRHRRR